jgi:1,4-alpha-glucan branching enzyme
MATTTTTSTKSAIADGVTEQELERLFALHHSDPYSILGPHPGPSGTTVRAYQPEAESINLIPQSGKPLRMSRREGTDLFEAVVKGRKPDLAYRLEMLLKDGTRLKVRDPYSFPPTLGETDLYLLGEQTMEKPYEKMGANLRQLEGVEGVAFAVWAPNAAGVSVVGDFNNWDGRVHQMRCLGSSGIWEIFIPELEAGARYKYEIRSAAGGMALKTDPFAKAMEPPPATASIVYHPSYTFEDDQWMRRRKDHDQTRAPLSIYEIHLGSWRRVPEENNRPLTYREMAPILADYIEEMGFTHVEFLPLMEHPFAGSWGYQVSGYFAPTARFGSPDDFRFLVDHLHRRGIGVILDWVPAHFPKDAFSLGRFDGTALYEHLDPRQGEHPEWGTYVFNYGRGEVRNFLITSALFWLAEYHNDGLRVDAVASMLYLDYGRHEGQWIPNVHGGRENLEAISLLQALNRRAYEHDSGVMMIAEESTDWPAVSRPTYVGGLGFGFKWDMGWMHDTLEYFSKDPIHRRYHHRDLTFGLLYAFSENFILPLSHDEVVYGKRSLLSKMPGDRWQQFANLRSLYGYMWARPGKKMLFMGQEFGQYNEWNHDQSLDWNLLEEGGPEHRGVQALMRDINRIYREEPALWAADADPAGFRWIDADNADDNVIAFIRIAPASGRKVVCICNFSPVVRRDYRLGLPEPGYYREILNTDAEYYGGGNVGNNGGVDSEPIPSHGLDQSAAFTLPPLAVVWFEAPLPAGQSDS